MNGKDPGELKGAVEALLFASPAPLTPKRICQLMPGADRDVVKEAISLLARDINQPGRGIELVETAGGWRIQTRPEFADKIRLLRRKPAQRLSRAALETLAIIAYRQPVTRAEIEKTRGVDSSGTIRFLLEKRLIRITGRKDVPGRPLIYGTTRRFLEVFQLRDLKALPSQKELGPGKELQRRLFEDLPETE